MATKVTVGGKDHLVNPLVFATLEKVWPKLQVVQTETTRFMERQKAARENGGDMSSIIPPDTVKMMNHAVGFIALAMLQDSAELKAIIADEKYAGMNEEEKDNIVIAHIKGLITSVEVQKLEGVISQIMEEAGFKMQEPNAGESPASPSTAIGTDSSQSLSPPAAKEGPGTE